MRAWIPERRETLFAHPLLSLERQRLAAGDARREALVVHAPDWVNVIPRLDDGRIVMVRQWRYGLAAPTLEIPGGVVEAESFAEAAARELREETGFVARSWRPLGEVSPNPAILSNRCATFLASDLERLGEPEGDGEEEIELVLVPEEEVADLVRRGEIHHSLVVAAFHLLALAR